ncbi:MAG: DUF4058 family protein [Gemmataceae bacterium]
MPSPFPGMDPWLESPGAFPSVHGSLIHLIRDALNAQLPDSYFATTDRLVWVDPELRREPDVSAFGPEHRPGGEVPTGPFAEEGMVAVAAEPVAEPWEEPYLEIMSAEGDRLVTAIEILSPANKRSGDNGRTSYLQKQNEFRLGNVNLVEIDLLRGGAHTTAIPLPRLRQIAPRFDYHVCVTVIGDPTQYQVKPFLLTDRLPTIVVPLDPGVMPVKVDLQSLFDRDYDIGRYARLARYAARPPDPPLTAEQQAWASGILKEKGLIP